MASCLLAELCTEGGRVVSAQFEDWCAADRIKGNPSLSPLQSLSQNPGLIFSTSPLYAFLSRMPVVPDLALLPRKRFWSGQIDFPAILARLKTQPPRYLILSGEYISQPGWSEFLDSLYSACNFRDDALLYKLRP